VRPAASTDRQDFPRLREDIGEDPARFLDRPLLEYGFQTGAAPLVKARIAGIDYLDVIRAWIAVERRLDRGPRDNVIRWLERREETLQAKGERDDRLESLDDREERDVETIVVRYDSETSDPYRLSGGGRKGTRRRFLDEDPLADDHDDREHVDDLQEGRDEPIPPAVATDGGDLR